MNYLVVRNAESAKRIHIEEISVLLIESTAVSLTAYLLCELSKRKIDVIFCDEKRCPAGLYLPLYGSLDNNINAALNYGYGILLSAFVREIVANGYSTQLGIFHDNMFNHYNLACDLMEPFRPFIDYAVTRAELSEFGHSEKMKLVQALNRQIIIDGKTQYMTNAIKIFVKSIFDALGENDISKIRLPDYELQIYENADIF